jgi:hypothetical protein
MTMTRISVSLGGDDLRVGNNVGAWRIWVVFAEYVLPRLVYLRVLRGKIVQKNDGTHMGYHFGIFLYGKES